MSEFIAKPTFSAAYGTDIFVGTIPDNTNVALYRVLTGGPYRGAIGQNGTFGFWCMEACMRCDAYPPCIIIPKKISLPKNAPILVRIALDPRKGRFLRLGTLAQLATQLNKFHADLGGTPRGFHLYAITSPAKNTKQLLAIPVAAATKKKAANRR